MEKQEGFGTTAASTLGNPSAGDRSTVKREIVCITRHGLNFIHTEGADFAAKVTAHEYRPGECFCPSDDVKQELLIPRWPS